MLVIQMGLDMQLQSDLRILDTDYSGADWLNTIEAATYLRIFRKDGKPCVERLRNLSSQGRIPSYKPFGKLLFKRSELQKIIEASRRGSHRGRK